MRCQVAVAQVTAPKSRCGEEPADDVEASPARNLSREPTNGADGMHPVHQACPYGIADSMYGIADSMYGIAGSMCEIADSMCEIGDSMWEVACGRLHVGGCMW